MLIDIITEAGYEQAILGLSLSYGISCDRAKIVALELANKDGGHNKFLESIYLWFDIKAPRFWWQEADTYRLSTKQSESTMHTLIKNGVTQADFEYSIANNTIERLNNMIKRKEPLEKIKNELPEGFLQRRIWVMNYKTLRNIIQQRETHRLPQWKQFCAYVRKNAEYSTNFLPLLTKTNQQACQETES